MTEPSDDQTARPSDHPFDRPADRPADPGAPAWSPYQAPAAGYPGGYPAPGGYPTAGGYPVGPSGYPVPVPYLRDHPQSATALALGIGGLAGTFLCGVLVLLGPFAWFFGAKARREIDAAPHQYGGRSQAVTGMVLGMITTGLLVLAVVGVVVVVVVLLAAGGGSDY